MLLSNIPQWYFVLRGHHSHDCIVVGLIITYAISAYHNHRCEFESCSRDVYSIKHYVFVSGFVEVLRLPPPIKLTATI